MDTTSIIEHHLGRQNKRLKVLVIGNLTDERCGFKNISDQTLLALGRHPNLLVEGWDGTYSQVYHRREAGEPYAGFLPAHAARFDVIHLIWHPATMGHYAGCPWDELPGALVRSGWNGCPQAFFPSEAQMTVNWTVLETKLVTNVWGWYPIPDWIAPLPPPDPVFTVGYSGVRGDGLGRLTDACAKGGWVTNFSDPTGPWLSIEDEVRRLARSTVNVSWYSGINKDRAGAVMTCLASGRPQVVNKVPMFAHLEEQADLYQGEGDELYDVLCQVEADWRAGTLRMPTETCRLYSWTRMANRFYNVWGAVRDGWRL